MMGLGLEVYVVELELVLTFQRVDGSVSILCVLKVMFITNLSVV